MKKFNNNAKKTNPCCSAVTNTSKFTYYPFSQKSLRRYASHLPPQFMSLHMAEHRPDAPFSIFPKRDSTLFARYLMEHEMLRVSTMDIPHVSDFKRDYA